MDHESEVIQQQMRQTRQALSEKLECLEDKVMGTVKSVTSTVDSVTAAARDTVNAAKETVQDTLQTARQTVHETVASAQETMHGAVDAMRHSLDLQRHVQERPWTMMGASFAAGFLGGYVWQRAPQPAAMEVRGPAQAGARKPRSATPNGHGKRDGARTAPSRVREALSGMVDTFAPELAKLKSLGVSALVGVIRDVVSRSVPETVAPRLEEVIDEITAKLGGEPIPGPVVPGLVAGAGGPGGESGEMPGKMGGRMRMFQ
jgi:ElaB/YqjD/DUF883 family membrane-anchored ribosome-binding protein